MWNAVILLYITSQCKLVDLCRFLRRTVLVVESEILIFCYFVGLHE